MDGWPQEISEHNDQLLMNTRNINDDAQLKGFQPVGTFCKWDSACDVRKKKKKKIPNLSLCASSGENFHASSSETESAIKCLKPALNPNRSCLTFSWKTSTSSNTCAGEIMGGFSEPLLYSMSEPMYSSAAAYKYRRTDMNQWGVLYLFGWQ